MPRETSLFVSASQPLASPRPEDCSRLILELDRVLELAAGLWKDAKINSPERARCRVRLDGLLDERLRLMSIRDGGTSPQ